MCIDRGLDLFIIVQSYVDGGLDLFIPSTQSEHVSKLAEHVSKLATDLDDPSTE